MSIFGQIDVATIKTNQYFIEAGEYSAEVTKAYFKENRNGQKQLVITYTINNEDSVYLDKPVSQYFTLPDPNLTAESFELLPVDEKKKIQGTLSSMKRTLCGNAANARQKGLGVNPDDLNDPEWNPETLVGTKVDLSIGNYGDEGVSIRWVNLSE